MMVPGWTKTGRDEVFRGQALRRHGFRRSRLACAGKRQGNACLPARTLRLRRGPNKTIERRRGNCCVRLLNRPAQLHAAHFHLHRGF